MNDLHETYLAWVKKYMLVNEHNPETFHKLVNKWAEDIEHPTGEATYAVPPDRFPPIALPKP